jgi:hypothetical protein
MNGNETDLVVESEGDEILKNPEGAVVQESLVPEVLPPIMQPKLNTKEHIRNEDLACQVRDMARMGLSKGSTAIAARITPYLLDKYYLPEFLEGQSQMQKGLATVAMEQALNGNIPILLHLLKTKLGWTETQTIEHVGEIKAVVSAKPMSKEEFAQKYLSQDKES